MGFRQPEKLVNDQADMVKFETSPAKRDVNNLIMSLSRIVAGLEVPEHAQNNDVKALIGVLEKIQAWTDDIEPLKDRKQRFGNVRYRDLIAKVHEEVPGLLEQAMPKIQSAAWLELGHYFLASFGSLQRLDFGTGHELNFLAFWGGVLRVLPDLPEQLSGSDHLAVFDAYFTTCRKIIRQYNLEPAGSHGVWGLDDHFHLPYILGAAQLAPIPAGEGDFPPNSVLDRKAVSAVSKTNLYAGAINFIYEMKRGNFFEHSPVLYDVSAVPSWLKIRDGMIKMYNAEVLGKFPVIQHFWFASLYPLTATPAKRA